MIVISRNLVLTGSESTLSANHPIIGLHNLVTISSIAADTAHTNYPATNLANPSTNLEWRAGDDSEQYLTITTGEVDPIDYLAIARHNFGSALIPVSVEGYIDGDWEELVGEIILSNDSPVLFRFTAQSLSQIRLRMQEGDEEPRAAVLYCGKLLVVERKIYADHTPMPQARKTSVSNGRSESGNFLGRIVLGEGRESSVPLRLLSPTWFRANMDSFLEDAQELPFFFAWRPGDYPREVGFCWLMNDPMPVPSAPSNRISMQLQLGGIA